MIPVPAKLVGGALDGEVVGFGAATREDDLGRTGPDGSRHPIAGVLDPLPGLAPEPMDGGGIPEILGEPRDHGLPSLRDDGRSSRIIEIPHP